MLAASIESKIQTIHEGKIETFVVDLACNSANQSCFSYIESLIYTNQPLHYICNYICSYSLCEKGLDSDDF